MNTETDPTVTTTTTDTTGATADAANPDGQTSTATTTPEGQGNGETAAADAKTTEGDGSKDGEAEGAPEAYSSFDLPEGFALEGERFDKASEYFKSKGYTQAQAQEAVNLYCEFAGQDAAAVSESTKQLVEQATEDARAQQIDAWGTQSKTEFADKYDGMVENARYAVSALEAARPDLKDTFNKLGWGNHPDLIFVFDKFGSMLRESGIDSGSSRQTNAGETRQADRMYPNMKP